MNVTEKMTFSKDVKLLREYTSENRLGYFAVTIKNQISEV